MQTKKGKIQIIGIVKNFQQSRKILNLLNIRVHLLITTKKKKKKNKKREKKKSNEKIIGNEMNSSKN